MTIRPVAVQLAWVDTSYLGQGGGGGICGEGGIGGDAGGVGGALRTPQSLQSLPRAQASYSDPGPPSSHWLLPDNGVPKATQLSAHKNDGAAGGWVAAAEATKTVSGVLIFPSCGICDVRGT